MINRKTSAIKDQSTSELHNPSISREYLNSHGLVKQSTSGLGHKKIGSSLNNTRPTFLFSFLSSNNIQESRKTQKSHASLKLSEVIASKATGVVLESRKISVVEKFITEIDEIPSRYLGIETLFLSNNCITSLKNICQWKNLRVLSIANNNIEILSELDHLIELSCLRVLNLEFNPVAQLPYYRAHVLYRLAELQTLDNKDVQSSELRKAEGILKKDETFLNMLFHHECITAKLATGLKHIRDNQNHRMRMIHKLKLLSSKNMSRLDSKSILDIWEMKDVYSEKDRPFVYHMLRCEVKKIYNMRMFGGGTIKEPSSFISPRVKASKTDQWELSYNEALLLQQQIIAKLLYQLENENEKTFKLIYKSDKVIDQLLDEDLNSLPNRDHLVSELRQTVNVLVDNLKQKYASGKVSIEEERQEEFSLTRLQDRQSIYNREPITTDMLDTPPANKHKPKSTNSDHISISSSRDPAEGYPREIQHSISHRTTLVHSLPPQQQDPLTPVKNEKPQIKVKETRKPTTSSTASTKLSKLAASKSIAHSNDTTEKEKVQLEQVTLLEKKLQERIVFENELRSLNSELREKLERYKNQNHENNLKAIEERRSYLNELQVLKDKYLSSQQLLESKIQESQELKRLLTERNQDNQEMSKLIIEFNRKQEIMDEELTQIRSSHKKLEDLLHLAKSDILSVTSESDYIKRVASEYSKELHELFSLEHQIEKADSFYRKRLMEKSFFMLVAGMREIKFLKIAAQRIGQRSKKKTVAQFFLQWKQETKISRLSRRVERTSSRLLLSRGMFGLYIFAEQQKELTAMCEKREFLLLRNSFHGWVKFRRKEMLLSEAARKVSGQIEWLFLRNTFDTWKNAVNAKKEKEKDKSLQIEECKSNLILRKAFRAWQKYIYQNVYANLEKEKALNLYLDQRLAVRTLICWKNLLQLRRGHRVDEDRAINYYKLHLTKTIFHTWKKTSVERKMETVKWGKAIALHDRSTLKQFFDLLRSRTHYQKRRKISFLKAINFYFTQLRRKALDSLIAYNRHRRNKLEKENQADRRYTYILFRKWRAKVADNRVAYHLESLVHTVTLNSLKHIRARYFKKWKQLTENSVKLARIEQEFKDRKSKLVVWNLFRKWVIRYAQSLRGSLHNKTKESNIFEKELQTWSEKLSAANLENLQLIEQIHALTAEVSVLRTDTREKNEQLSVLQKTVEDSVIIESSLRREINGYRDQISDYESELSRLKVLVVSKEDETEQTMEKILELQNAKYRIQSLEALVDEKNAELGRLHKTISIMESSTSDIQEKLQSSFELSSSLRKLLDDKDRDHRVQLSEIEENRRKDFQAYEARVSEMAQVIANLERHVKYAEGKNKKMSYEIQLLSRRDENQLSDLSDLDHDANSSQRDEVENTLTGVHLGFEQSSRNASTDDRELRELLLSKRITNPPQLTVPQIMKTNLEELREHKRQMLEEETEFEMTKNSLLEKEANRYKQKDSPFSSIINRSVPMVVPPHQSIKVSQNRDETAEEDSGDVTQQREAGLLRALHVPYSPSDSSTSISSSTSIVDLDKEIKKLQNEILDRLSKK